MNYIDKIIISLILTLPCLQSYQWSLLSGYKSSNWNLKASKPTVWSVFSEIAINTGASNLGQGFPDWQPPPFVLDALQSTINSPYHQYTRPAGHPPLVQLLANAYTTHFHRPIDAFSEVAITVGASQALYLTLMTLLKPGDEVVMFEPYFDLYMKQLKLIPNVNPRLVPLGGAAATPQDPWALDIEALRKTINKNTKILLLNTPHNPTGKVFTYKELEMIANLVAEYPNLVVVSDEVYKFSVYDPFEEGDSFARGHYHFARLPRMWDRTITLSSCGKTFSITGWQAGWMIGPSKYIIPVHEMIPCVQFCASTPIQAALSLALPQATLPYEGYPTYYEWLRSQFSTKRKILETGLKALNMESMPSRGGFFLLTKLPKINLPEKYNILNEPYDWKYCRMLAHDYGVVGIPASPFFSSTSSEDSPSSPSYTGVCMARFAICKKDETLQLAARKLMSSPNLPTSENILIR